ncbi:DMT family transporter [Variovorax sp. dw_954]|uniref:DMT family transporter n=1 Tax=Variovorax sp. dw_954 TaxID=2720078 RepID=UPI001BD6A0B5|nr:DMT family transporter [Variovorax sp. dw_954]
MDHTQRTSPAASNRGLLAFVSGGVLLGTLGVFVQEAHAHPLTTTWFRCAFGLLGLTLWSAARGQLGTLLPPRKAWVPVLAAAGLMVAGWVLFFAAIERTSIGVATVLFHIQPLWVLVLGAWWLGEAVAPGRLAAVLVAMAGLTMATGLLDPAFGSGHAGGEVVSTDYWVGVGLCLIGAFLTACVTVIARRLRDLGPITLAWWQCAVGTVAFAAWPMIHGWPAFGTAWGWLIGLGIIHTGLAYVLLYGGMAHLATDRIAVLQFIYPAVAIGIDWLVYGHALGPVQLAGVALMAGALWFAANPQAGHSRWRIRRRVPSLSSSAD